MSSHDAVSKHTVINEILPKAGLVYSEKGNLSEVLCKPKIMPLKSATLKQMEAIEKGRQGGNANPKSDGGIGGMVAESAGSGGVRVSQKQAEVMSFD